MQASQNANSHLLAGITVADSVADDAYTLLVASEDTALRVNQISCLAPNITSVNEDAGVTVYVLEGTTYHFVDFIPVLLINLRPYKVSNPGNVNEPTPIAYAVWTRGLDLLKGQALYVTTSARTTSADKTLTIAVYGAPTNLTPITQVLTQ